MAKTVNFPKVICTVRALYTYSSTESSSLTFEKGDLIDVLTQLDSGWWDGWCKGNRGWFPSNYVEVIHTADNRQQQLNDKRYMDKSQSNLSNSLPSSTPISMTEKSSKRKSFQSSIRNSIRAFTVATEPDDESMSEEQTEPLPEGWTLHIASDGQTKFYFNQHTGGLRYTHPALLESDDDEEEGDNERDRCQYQQDECYSESRNSIDNSDFGLTKMAAPKQKKHYSPCSNTIECQCESRTAHGVKGCRHTAKFAANDSYKEDSMFGRKGTSQRTNNNNQSNLSPQQEQFDKDIPVNWKAIATNIAQSVQDLHKAIISNQQSSEFRAETYAVVDAVRYMLFSSRSLDKDAFHLQDQEVKETLRLVLSTLAKLILSAKVVNDINSESTDNSKIKRDAADVLTATRRFVTLCQSKNIQIQQIQPELKINENDIHLTTASTYHGRSSSNKRDSGTIINASNIRAKYPLNQDLVVSLQTHAKQIVGSTDALCKATTFLHNTKQQEQQEQQQQQQRVLHDGSSILSTPTTSGQHLILEQKSRSNIILLFQNLTSQIGNYFSILEDIDLMNVDVSQLYSLPDYYCNKQRLYNAVGLLFSAVQTLTNTMNDLATSVALVEQNIANVENTIEIIFSNVVQMVAERKVWLMRTGDNGNMAVVGNNKEDEGPISTTLPSTTPQYLSIRSPSKEGSQPSQQQQQATTNSGQQSETLRKQSSIKLPSQSLNSNNKRTLVNRQPSNNNTNNNSLIDPSQPATRSQFWFLGYDYDEIDLEFTQDKNIKGGTLRALVERLTLHDYIDMSFIANFLLTYRSFCTTEEFVALLQERYNLAPPESLTPDELELWTDKKQKLVRLRVFNVMKNWLENYYNDEDEFILDKLQFFANTVICDSSSFSAEQLNRLIRKRRELEENTGGLKKLIPNTLYGPMPIMPKNLQQIHLLDTDPLEMARQLTIMDFKLYSSIQPIECLGKAWCKDGSTAVNVKQSIDYCNRLTAWVTGTILSNKEAKKRVILFKYWAQVANRCLQMNNFNTCMAVLSAFDNSAVARLKKTWELVSSRTNQGLAHIRKLMGSNKNFQEYREMIHSVNPPCIPFLGIYLQDLTFIEDGNPDILKKSNNLINFAKRQKAAEVIREIKQFQSPPYNFQYVPEIQEYIKLQLETSKDIDFLYERSLELEPRNNTTGMTVTDNTA